MRHFILVIAGICWICGCAASGPRALDSNRRGEVFATEQEALEAFVAAFRSQDPDRVVAIFGEVGRQIIDTGDPISDRAFMRRMAGQLQRRAELLPVISEEYANEQWYKVRYGIEGWLMRIPLINRGAGWYFETRYAGDAVGDTRRAMNEVEAVSTLWSIMEAQRRYKRQDWDGDGVLEYAGRFMSSPGERDGLYSPSAEGGTGSPLDRVVAEALQKGYTISSAGSGVYEGYRYKILTAQGKKARGGRRSYLENGSLTRGYAVLAYPVSWNASGTKSFLASADGKVFKKDMGSNTESLGEEMNEFDPDSTWALVEHPDNYSERTIR